ncbi:hypothetical protein [Mannheimia varigena]|uniref:hypothetical protein n=1 Tax=Mannheimia varigena TaxID=85404 RepID=UPI001106EACD|nr:hypothetical protein [Mannheimia varigena]TLU76030.1 hypothetical protein FE589_00845 [Mannheimia varigena]
MDFNNLLLSEISKLDSFRNTDISILEKIIDQANQYHKCWSQSALGYHAYVYYKDFLPPPKGEYFSQESGLGNHSGYGSRGKWIEYTPDEVKHNILDSYSEDEFDSITNMSNELRELIDDIKSDLLLHLNVKTSISSDKYLEQLTKELEQFYLPKFSDYSKNFFKRFGGKVYTRDTRIFSEGVRFIRPPHQDILCQVYEYITPFKFLNEFIKKCLRIIKYLGIKEQCYIGELSKMEQQQDILCPTDHKIINNFQIGSVQNLSNGNTGNNFVQTTRSEILNIPIFDELKRVVREQESNTEIIEDLISLIEEMEKNKNSNNFKLSFNDFLSKAKDSVSLGKDLIDIIPKLTEYFS